MKSWTISQLVTFVTNNASQFINKSYGYIEAVEWHLSTIYLCRVTCQEWISWFAGAEPKVGWTLKRTARNLTDIITTRDESSYIANSNNIIEFH